MGFKIGDKIRIEWEDEDFDSGSLVGETGVVLRLANRQWHGGDVIVDLDCGINGLIYDSDLLIKL